MGAFTTVSKDILSTIQTEAGILLSKFDPTATSKLGFTDEDIIGATTGGFTFTDTPTITDYGEDLDNVPGQLKELQRITSRTVTLASTFAGLSEKAIALVMGSGVAANYSAGGGTIGRTLTPTDTISLTDFKDIYWVGDYSQYTEDGNTNSGFLCIHLRNAYSTGGFALTTSKGAKGTLAFTLSGFYSASNIKTLPYEIYIRPGKPASQSLTTSSTPIVANEE